MVETVSGPVVGFQRMLELLMARGREVGLLVVPGAGAADVDELVRIAAARAASSPAGQARTYTALLAIASVDGAPLPAGSWERVAQMWEAIGGTWGGRVSPEARGLFVWSSRA